MNIISKYRLASAIVAAIFLAATLVIAAIFALILESLFGWPISTTMLVQVSAVLGWVFYVDALGS